MLTAAVAVSIVVFCLIPKEGSVFSGEIVVEVSGHRKDHYNVVAMRLCFGKCQCENALWSVLQLLKQQILA